MTTAEIRSLLREYENERLSDRRQVIRKPLVRPCRIVARHRRDEIHFGFSRDISHKGIGVIGQFDWTNRSIASITVHMLKSNPISFDAELRWSESFGKGWFLTGWVFLDA